jgi:ABC-type uncharacterized transport system permease subunit
MSPTLSPTLLYVAGGLIFAVMWALLMARKGVRLALSGSRPRRGGTALPVEFCRAVAVTVPLTVVAALLVWSISSPNFNPPPGPIRW